MKALKFSFVLFGLFFLSNGTLKAQPTQITVEVQNISPPTQGNGLQGFNITIVCNIPARLAISLHEVGVNGTPPRVAMDWYDLKSINNPKTQHSFKVSLPTGDIAYLRCGYIDKSDVYKPSDGGCIFPN